MTFSGGARLFEPFQTLKISPSDDGSGILNGDLLAGFACLGRTGGDVRGNCRHKSENITLQTAEEERLRA